VTAAEANLDGARSQLATAEVSRRQAQSKLDEAQATRERAVAARKLNQASREEANLQFNRAQYLLAVDSITRANYDRANARRQETQAAVEEAEGQVALAEAQIRTSREAISSTQTQIDTAKAQVQASQAKVSNAREQLTSSQAALKGARAQLTGSQAQVESARAAVKAARAAVKAAQAQVEGAEAGVSGARAGLAQSKVPLGDTTLSSPMDSVVMARQVEVGALLQPGSTAFMLGNLTQVKAVFGVPDLVVRSLRIGTPVTMIFDALPGREFRGQISQISPAADPTSRVFQVEVLVPNAGRQLDVGMIGTLELPGERLTRPVSVLPVSAIISPPGGQEGYAVYVLDESGGQTVARMRKVELGQAFGNKVAIRSGLQPGERVIANVGPGITDGGAVRVTP